MNDKPVVANITQQYYDSLAPQYDRFYAARSIAADG